MNSVVAVADATKTIQYGMTQNEAPGSPAPGLEAEVRRLREENASLKDKMSGMCRTPSLQVTGLIVQHESGLLSSTRNSQPSMWYFWSSELMNEKVTYLFLCLIFSNESKGKRLAVDATRTGVCREQKSVATQAAGEVQQNPEAGERGRSPGE